MTCVFMFLLIAACVFASLVRRWLHACVCTLCCMHTHAMHASVCVLAEKDDEGGDVVDDLFLRAPALLGLLDKQLACGLGRGAASHNLNRFLRGASAIVFCSSRLRLQEMGIHRTATRHYTTRLISWFLSSFLCFFFLSFLSCSFRFVSPLSIYTYKCIHISIPGR